MRVLVLLTWGIAAILPVWAETPSLIGFTPERAAQQIEREKAFDAEINRDNLKQWMLGMAGHPHPVGSIGGKENAEWMVEQFRSWGYEAELAVYEVLCPTPTLRRVELLGETPYVAQLSEPAVEGDRTSAQTRDRLPPFNAYSIDGDVTGELVYVNYGVPRDYEVLARQGISVEGKIVIARYGGSWRGIKPKLAAEMGAIGCLIYSDPRDDGYFQGPVYPEGPFRNADGAQRGSVSDMPLFPGDPLTPGKPSIEGTKRLALDEAPTLTKIPVLPISYRDAEPLLRALGGEVAPQEWRGALPLTYRMGPGPGRVRLQVKFDWKQVPAYNVIARLAGSERPDQWIMRGNHHDAWVHGAADPVSGMVALMEEARAIATLVEQGWQPKRTIVYAGWDAEEPGLVGSTEWVEHHAKELDRSLVTYINTDGNGRGFLRAGGSHSLERLMQEVARDVIDPQTGVSIARRRQARRQVQGAPHADEPLRLDALGSGSDYTPFLQHLGIASLNLGFGGENRGGSYHSAYDSIDYYQRFGDPGFAYGATLARTAGRLTMRLADADVLPFEFSRFAQTVQRYVDELSDLEQSERDRIARQNRLLDERAYTLAADPTKVFVDPEREEPVPHLNMAPLRNSLERLHTAADKYATALATGASIDLDESRRIDRLLFTAERLLTRREGLPRRSWFRHQIYAPGFYTGYGVKTIPGVREAIEEGLWEEAAEQIERVAAVLDGYAERIDAIAERWSPTE